MAVWVHGIRPTLFQALVCRKYKFDWSLAFPSNDTSSLANPLELLKQVGGVCGYPTNGAFWIWRDNDYFLLGHQPDIIMGAYIKF
jgi:hypothetical protein